MIMKRMIITAIALAFSIVSYGQADWSKAFMAGKQRRADIFTHLDARPGSVIFAGGSIMEDCEWKELFENDEIINRGIDGDTLEEFIARLPEITRHDASKIFIEIGSSDLNGKSPEEVLAAMEDILKTLRKDSPKSKIHVLSVLPSRKAAPNPFGPTVEPVGNETIKAYNKNLRKLCRKNRATFIDIFDEFTGPDGTLDERLGSSNTKLSVDGYARLKSCLQKYL